MAHPLLSLEDRQHFSGPNNEMKTPKYSLSYEVNEVFQEHDCSVLQDDDITLCQLKFLRTKVTTVVQMLSIQSTSVQL